MYLYFNRNYPSNVITFYLTTIVMSLNTHECLMTFVYVLYNYEVVTFLSFRVLEQISNEMGVHMKFRTLRLDQTKMEVKSKI